MPLTIYRRHSADCQVHTLRLSPRELRHYRDCECPIWLNGTTDTQRYPRQSLGTREWGVAEARVRAITAEAVEAAQPPPHSNFSGCVSSGLRCWALPVSGSTGSGLA